MRHINAYGCPLDNRATYTKSDWTVWTATLAPHKDEFEKFIAPMWEAFNVSQSRVPRPTGMTPPPLSWWASATVLFREACL